jgi:mannose-6-phosphate isomerase-like protein (cupin superfamily)
MFSLKAKLLNLNVESSARKGDFVRSIGNLIEAAGYTIVESNDEKPWGAYFRLDSGQADDFVTEFFPGLSITEARLNMPSAELSPKILIVSPAQRLSWQYHNRRAERWAFLTEGAFYKSETDDQGEIIEAKGGDIIQFSQAERHRLVGASSAYTIVAEIWQHVDLLNPSNEDDITRLSDDYSR